LAERIKSDKRHNTLLVFQPKIQQVILGYGSVPSNQKVWWSNAEQSFFSHKINSVTEDLLAVSEKGNHSVGSIHLMLCH